MRRTLLAIAAALAVAAPAGAAEPAVFFMTAPSPIGLPFADDAAVPACDGYALSQIGWRVGAASIEWVRETRSGSGYPSLIGRRYCEARAIVHDGRLSAIYYVIESHQQFAGIGAKVTFCLPGYDPWRVHDAACRTVRPQ